VGAAASMAVAITDPALIAASSDGTPGSNGNIAVLSAVHDQAVAGGQTPTDYYSNIVFAVGNDVANNTAELSASQSILSQLQDQRASISGVSLDEEASNMVQFQRAFDAAAQVVTSVNDMPRSCAEAGVLQRVVSLTQIPGEILQATGYCERAHKASV
jgi:flagellar hook-associated protein 1 FlgK